MALYNLHAQKDNGTLHCVSESGRSIFTAGFTDMKEINWSKLEIDSVVIAYEETMESKLIFDHKHKVLTTYQNNTKNQGYTFYSFPETWIFKEDEKSDIDVKFKATMRGADPRNPNVLSPIIDLTCRLQYHKQ